MAEDYTQEQLWKIYEKLPQKTKEMIFSEKTAEKIIDICIKNEVADNQISEVARYTGRVLLGILPKNEFQKTLEEKLEIKKDVAQKIAQEINQSIFSLIIKESSQEKVKEKPKRPPGEDIYREHIE